LRNLGVGADRGEARVKVVSGIAVQQSKTVWAIFLRNHLEVIFQVWKDFSVAHPLLAI
jgi:hypothetical protein